MSIEELLRCLIDVESGVRRPQWCEPRYVLEQRREPDEDDGDWDEEEPSEFLVTAPSSLYEVLNALGAALLEHDPEVERLSAVRDELVARSAPPVSVLVARLEAPGSLATAQLLLGTGPDFSPVITSTEPAAKVFEPEPLGSFRYAHYVFNAYTDPDGEQEWSILECRPVADPAPAERELLRAAAAGETSTVDRAVAEGVDVDILDADGRSPLHHAVAGPHSATIAALLDAGADVNARDPRGRTPVDLAVAARPYPAAVIALIHERGGRSALLADRSLPQLLRALPLRDRDEQRHHGNVVRYLLETGGPQPDSLDWLLSRTGYYEREVSGEVLAELTELLLRNGAENNLVDDYTPLDHAQRWSEDPDHPQYVAVANRLREAGFDSVRDRLRRFPRGDRAAQRTHLDGIRRLLADHGTTRDALHLPLRAGWSAEEVSADVLAELTALLLEHGAPDASVMGLTPLDHAQALVDGGGHPQHQVVVDLLRDNGFTWGLHRQLAEFPLAGPVGQRKLLDRMRLLLEADGAHPETLHWWLFEHRWSADEADGDALAALTDLLLEHGAADTFKGSKEPLRKARYLAEVGGFPHYRPVVDRLAALP